MFYSGRNILVDNVSKSGERLFAKPHNSMKAAQAQIQDLATSLKNMIVV